MPVPELSTIIPMTKATQNQPKKILIVRLSAHGDVVQTLPLLNALKENDPDCTIGWLTEASAEPLLKNHPLIDHLHVSHRKQWLKKPNLKSFQAFMSLLNEIKSIHYDVSLDVQGLLKSALWPVMAGIRTRWGNQNARENASMFYTNTLSPHKITDKDTPAILRYTEFADAVYDKTPTLWPVAETEKEKRLNNIRFTLPEHLKVLEKLVSALLSDIDNSHPTIAIAPATMWQSKHWPASHWQKLLTLIEDSFPCNLLVLGSQENQVLNHAITEPLKDKNNINLIDLTGKTTLPDLYPLMSAVDVFIGSDSALLHIADAVSHTVKDTGSHTGIKPTIIGLYGATSASRTGPVGKHHSALFTPLDCQPCFKRICPLGTTECMEQLTPEIVFNTLKATIDNHAKTSGGAS